MLRLTQHGHEIEVAWTDVQHPPNTKLSMKVKSTKDNAIGFASCVACAASPFAFTGRFCLTLLGGRGEPPALFCKTRLARAALALSLRRSAGVLERDLRASMCTGNVRKSGKTRMLESKNEFEERLRACNGISEQDEGRGMWVDWQD